MSTRPSTTRRAMPRVALEVRRASRSSCRSSASRRRTSAPDSRSTVALELVDLLVQAVEQLEEGVGGIVDGGLEDRRPAIRPPRRGPRCRSPARGRPVLPSCGRSSRRSGSPRCRARGTRRDPRSDAPWDGRGRRARSCRAPRAAVARRDRRPRAPPASRSRRGRAASRSPAGRPPASGRRGRSTARPRRPRLAPGSAVAGRRARQEAAAADRAAWRCSLSQRSASSAAAQPDPAAVTAWRYT